MRNFEIKNQNGRSMIEMLGVLAIIGVLSVGGIAGYSKAMTKYRINKTIEQITLISQNIRTFYSTQKNYIGLSYTVINKAKLIPDEMEMIDGNYQGAFGTVTIGYATGKKGDGSAFSLGFASIPQEACIELLTMDWGSVASGFLGIAKGEPGWNHGYYQECSDCHSEHAWIALVGGTEIGIPFPMEKAIVACDTTNVIHLLFE
ncbi:MAG: hypothetical protein IKO06_00385 [Alphaproteobacteria bacterium]|nr:hypothetical protein [Alphaproteobacteria bacterium]